MHHKQAPIKVVFFGSPEFAAPSLEALADDPRFELALVITQPNRRAGRGKTMRPPAVRVVAERRGINLLQPVSVNDDPESSRAVQSVGADLFVVVAYGEKLGRELLATPENGCLNVHPSLLPRYRGSSPVPAAILNGDSAAGVSIIKLTRRLDAGPIVSQTAVKLRGNEVAGDLSQELSRIAANVLPTVAVGWCAGAIVPIRQVHAEATYTAELTRTDGRIDWRDRVERIERRVRALSPWPGSWTTIEGRRLAIGSVAVETLSVVASNSEYRICSQPEPGTLIAPNAKAGASGSAFPGIMAGNGVVRLLQVTPEGKRQMSGADWWRGSRLTTGARADLLRNDA